MHKSIFISDIHLNRYEGKALYASDYTWLSSAQNQHLVAFLKSLLSQDVQTLAILGDLFDDWIHPVDTQPPTMAQIAAANQDVVGALNDLRKRGVDLVYVRGNHDMTVSGAELQQIFPPAIGSFQFFDEGVYQDGTIHGEHSHTYCLFNAPDPTRFDRLPIGYYLSRLFATHASKATPPQIPDRRLDYEFHSLLNIDEKIATAFDILFLDNVLIRFLNAAGIDKNQNIGIAMPDGSNISIEKVRLAFKNLRSRWQGPDSASEAIAADCNRLLPVAEQILQNEPTTDVVLLGHSHIPDIQRYRGKVYANTGAWCHDPDAGYFVEVIRHADEDAGKSTVQLWKWANDMRQNVAKPLEPNPIPFG